MLPTATPGAAHATAIPAISLVVATYGRAEQLQTLLRSLLAQRHRDFEIFVVDQNTDDRIALILAPMQDAGLDIVHLRQSRPGLSAARNLALQHVRGAIVAFPDDDCWYDPLLLAQVVSHLAEHADIAGVVARWVEETPAKGGIEQLSATAWRRFRGGDAASITLFLRTALLRQRGDFDERLGAGTWYGSSEDTDLVLRLLGSGDRLDYLPDALVHHALAKSVPMTTARCWRELGYGRGIGATYIKHRIAFWVVARGLFGPWVRALRAPSRLSGLVLATCTIAGRMQGMFSWYFREK